MPVERLLEAELSVATDMLHCMEPSVKSGTTFMTSHCMAIDIGDQVDCLQISVISARVNAGQLSILRNKIKIIFSILLVMKARKLLLPGGINLIS